MLVRFLEPGENELDEARDYYNAQCPGLGDEFLFEVLLTLERIQAYPTAWPLLSRQTRRCQTRRFPYGVVFAPPKTKYSLWLSRIYIAARCIGWNE